MIKIYTIILILLFFSCSKEQKKQEESIQKEALLKSIVPVDAMEVQLYANAWKMLSSRRLIDQPEGRSRQAEALNQLIRRLEVIRALSIADRGASTLRDVARETL